AVEGRRLGLREPRELGGPEGGVEERAGARMNRLRIELAREALGGVCAACVAPAENRRERVPLSVDGEEAVREARNRLRLFVAKHTPHGPCHLGRIIGVVL